MAIGDQKNPTRAWVETLSPIIIAMIGLIGTVVTVIYNSKNEGKDTESKQVETPIPAPEKQDMSSSPNKVAELNPIIKTVKKIPEIDFCGNVTDINGNTGLQNIFITYENRTVKSQSDGSFCISIPKNMNTFFLQATSKGFAAKLVEFNLKDNGKAIIKLRPK